MEDKPMFVKIEEFKEIENTMELVKSKIDDAKASLTRIESLKREEENEINQWKYELEEIQKKVMSIEEKLSEN